MIKVTTSSSNINSHTRPKPIDTKPEPQGPKLLTAGIPLHIKSIACVCGDSCVEEAELMVTSLRAWNATIPVLILTDEINEDEVKDRMSRFDQVYVDVIAASHFAKIKSTLADVARHVAGIWSVEWISLKMEAVHRALTRFGRGVLLVDADIIFTGKIPPLQWDADLVLSRHVGPAAPRDPLREDGPLTFNAGMILFGHHEVVDRWKQMFLMGVGGFYEQGCLPDLAREFVSDELPADWNWGFWRSEDLRASSRVPSSLHIHLADGATRRPHDAGIRSLAESTLLDIKKASGAPDRIAFIHHSKTAGASLMEMFVEAGRRGGWQLLDSWHPISIGRDWSVEELASLRAAGESRWTNKRRIVHNHSLGWPPDLVRKWKDDGWVFVSLYRDIRERLLSLYAWNTRYNIVEGDAKRATNLDDFIRLLLLDSEESVQIAPHPCHELIDHWGEAPHGGLSRLVRSVTGIDTAEAMCNTSSHNSWETAIERGELSKKTLQLVEEHAYTAAWDKIGESLRPSTANYQDELKGGWVGGTGVCGASSLSGPEDKASLLAELERIKRDMGRTPDVLEIGCGDLVWLGGSFPPRYTGMDLHRRDSWNEVTPRQATLFEADASEVPLPACDVAIARQVFIHMATGKVSKILSAIKKSGAKRLIASSVRGVDNFARHSDGASFSLFGDPVDLEAEPFNLIRLSPQECKFAVFQIP